MSAKVHNMYFILFRIYNPMCVYVLETILSSSYLEACSVYLIAAANFYRLHVPDGTAGLL